MHTRSIDQSPTAGGSGRLGVRHAARKDFDNLFQALQKGDLNSAQQAYSDLQQLRGQSSPSSSGATATSTDPVSNDWANLGSALQSGSLSAAQTAFQQLQSDAESAGQAAHQQSIRNAQSLYALMHSAQSAARNIAPPTAAAPQRSNATDTSSNPFAGIANSLEGLGQALKSGDIGSAQKVLTQLAQDFQTLSQKWSSGQLQNSTSAGGTTTTSSTTPTGGMELALALASAVPHG